MKMINITFESIDKLGFTVEEVTPMLDRLNFVKKEDGFYYNLNDYFEEHMENCFSEEMSVRSDIFFGTIKTENIKYINVLGDKFFLEYTSSDSLRILMRYKNFVKMVDNENDRLVQNFVENKREELEDQIDTFLSDE